MRLQPSSPLAGFHFGRLAPNVRHVRFSGVRVDRLVVEHNRSLVSLCSGRSIDQVLVVRDAPCLEELSLGEGDEGDDAYGVDSGNEQQQGAEAIEASDSVDILLSLADCAALTYLHMGNGPPCHAARRLRISTLDSFRRRVRGGDSKRYCVGQAARVLPLSASSIHTPGSAQRVKAHFGHHW
jgi:hypothetical protein